MGRSTFYLARTGRKGAQKVPACGHCVLIPTTSNLFHLTRLAPLKAGTHTYLPTRLTVDMPVHSSVVNSESAAWLHSISDLCVACACALISSRPISAPTRFVIRGNALIRPYRPQPLLPIKLSSAAVVARFCSLAGFPTSHWHHPHKMQARGVWWKLTTVESSLF